MEIQRHAVMGPYGIQHVCTQDITVHGVTIPAGTILQGLYAEIFKGDHWEDGMNFRPERFISENGKIRRDEHFVPFSMGRRKCPGETLARTEMFLFFTNLVNDYHILPEVEGEIPSEKYNHGLTILPLPFKVRLLVRNNSIKT